MDRLRGADGINSRPKEKLKGRSLAGEDEKAQSGELATQS